MAQNPAALASWLGAPAERGSVDMLTGEARLSIGATGMSLDQLKIELGDATWVGRIAAGDRVVVAGTQKLRAGSKVKEEQAAK